MQESETEVIYQADLDEAITFLQQCIVKNAPADATGWLDNKMKQIAKEKSDSLFFMTFSAISSYFSKNVLKPSESELAQAKRIRDHFNPSQWSLVQTARTYLVLNFARHHLERFKNAMDKVFSAADIYESIALYQALPLFPYPEKFLLHATNGIRSNMLSVFEAAALNNPYPADFFDVTAWNQVVLKTLFVDSPMEQIVGLKRRANPVLARALINTVRERFAAKRPIREELWCILGFSTNKEILPLVKALVNEKDPILVEGALLALDNCNLPEAKSFFDSHEEKIKSLQNRLNKLHNFAQQLVD